MKCRVKVGQMQRLLRHAITPDLHRPDWLIAKGPPTTPNGGYRPSSGEQSELPSVTGRRRLSRRIAE